MKLGTQMTARSDDDYRIMSQLGVTHISAHLITGASITLPHIAINWSD
jgi:hypothetical protein